MSDKPGDTRAAEFSGYAARSDGTASPERAAPCGVSGDQDPRTNAMRQEEVDATMRSLPGSHRRGPFYALTFRNFRLFFVGQLVSVAGTWMQLVAQNWVVWDITHQARWLGIVSGASAIPYVLFAIWGGQIADRLPRRTTLVCTQTVAMFQAFLLALLASGRWVPLQAWHIAALAGLLGIVNAFNMPAQQAFVTDMVSEREALGNAIALNSFRFNIARFLGPIMAGYALVHYGSALCFALNGVSYIAVILSLLMMRLPSFQPNEQRVDMWGGFHYIGQARSVLRITILVGASSILVWSFSTLFPVLSTEFHKGAIGYSRLMVFNGIGAAIGAALLAAYGGRVSHRALVYGGAFAFSGTLLLLSLSHVFGWIEVLVLISGIAMILFGMSANVRVQEEVPDALRGRVMAVYSLVFQGLMPVGGLEVGFLAQHFSAATAIRANALLSLIITGAIFAWMAADRRKANP